MRPTTLYKARAWTSIACGTIALTACLLAIWTPIGAWWQWLATAALAGIVGASLSGGKSR